MKQTYRIYAVLLFLFLAATSSHSQSWNALGSGINGTVNAAIVFNGQLIVAGSFTSPANNIARWNGSTWTALGTGTNGVVHALTIFNNNLIVGGAFNNVGNNIASWNGTTWTNLGLGTNDTVFALTTYNSTLRVGGKFTSSGGIVTNRVSLWSGSSWGAMPSTGSNGVNNTVYSLAVLGADLIIGGAFTQSTGGVNINRICRYNSGSGVYTAMGTGIDQGQVNALTVLSNTLYVGGTFTSIGATTVNRLARWTGSNWNTVGAGCNGPVNALYTRTNDVVVGGNFTSPGNSIASWNGTVFGTFGAGITGGNATVNDAVIWSNVFIAAGDFTTAGAPEVPASNVAGWGSVPAAPTLISPADGATGISINPTLDWSDVSSASTYGVQVSTNANFTVLVVNQTGLTASQFAVSSPLNNNTTYFWRATASNGLGTSANSSIRFFTTSMVGIINNQEIPVRFNLYQNFPNPFNPATKIRFDLPANSNPNALLKLSVYDITGRLVSELLNTSYAAGKWEIDFDASSLASGTYFYKIEAGDYTAINKMILVK